MDQLPRLGKRELICLLSFTCNYVVFVWRGFLFLWVLGMGYVILLWHSLSLPYKYFGLVKNVCDALSYLLDNIYIRFGNKKYRQIVGIPMGTNCAPFVADLFLFCFERDFMTSLSDDNQANIIEAFNSTSRYLDDLLKLRLHYNELAKRTATVWRYLTFGDIRCYTLKKSDECDH